MHSHKKFIYLLKENYKKQTLRKFGTSLRNFDTSIIYTKIKNKKAKF